MSTSDAINTMLISGDRTMSMAIVMLNQDVPAASESLTARERSLTRDLLDATLIHLLLLPAAMRLMGRWNWWGPTFGTRREQSPTVSTGTSDERFTP